MKNVQNACEKHENEARGGCPYCATDRLKEDITKLTVAFESAYLMLRSRLPQADEIDKVFSLCLPELSTGKLSLPQPLPSEDSVYGMDCRNGRCEF